MKTKKQLIDEVELLRRRVAELEDAEQERKKLEDILKKVEKRYTAYFDLGSVAIAIETPTGDWVEVNDRMCDVFGYTRNELFQKHWSELTYPDDLALDLDLFNQLIQNEIHDYSIDKRFFRKDGSIFWLSISVTCLRNPDGTPDKVLAYGIDITDHKQTEEALRVSYEIMETIFSTTHFQLVLLDSDFNFIHVNKAYADVCNHPQEYFIGKNHFELYPNKENEEIFRQVVKTGEPVYILAKSFDFPDQPELGTTYWDWTLIPVNNQENEVTSLVFSLHDVTGKIRAEEALRNSEARKDSILKTAMDGFWLIDRHGKIIDVNNALCRMTGYTGEDLMAMSVSDIEAIESPEDTVNHMEKVISEGSDRFESKHRCKNGNIIDVEVSSTWMPSEEMFFSFIRDITVLKEAERRKTLNTKILDTINKSAVWKDSIEEILSDIKKFTGFEAVAIRSREGDDFPYYVTQGFPGHFVEAERHLCSRNDAGDVVRDLQGNPYLECMCGNIICGRTDSNKDFFTEGGSFWSNNTTELLASTTDKDRQTRTRNRCNGEGYESVALIPLRAGQEILGLIQLNDTRTDCFTDDMIRFFEGIGVTIGNAFSRKLTEDALTESEERYRTVADFTYDWEEWVDENGRYLYISPSCERIIGLQSEEIIANPDVLLEMIHPEDLEIAEKHFSGELLARHTEVNQVDFRITDTNGEMRWISHTCQPVYSKDGHYRGRRGSNRDITHRIAAIKQVEEALRNKETLLSEIHHRVKNNLQVMSSLLNLQSRHAQSNDLKHQLIASQGRIRSMALVHEKLYISDNLANIRMDDYIRSMLSELSRLYSIDHRRIILDEKVDGTCLSMAASIPCGIVLNELITNAFQHAFPEEKSGRIMISLARERDDVFELVVQDNGIGIPNDVDIMTTDSLGLKLVRILVQDQLHGTIELQRDQGVKYIIRFREA